MTCTPVILCDSRQELIAGVVKRQLIKSANSDPSGMTTRESGYFFQAAQIDEVFHRTLCS